jgi:hypothetical protein
MAKKSHRIMRWPVMRWPDADEVAGSLFHMWLPADLRRRLESSLTHLNRSQSDGLRTLKVREIILTAVGQWIEEDEKARADVY